MNKGDGCFQSTWKTRFYDAIVIGGGPAGLSAACYLAKDGFKTLLLERLSRKGILAHPCGCMFSPIKNYVTFEKQKEGVYFKEVEFTFPNETIIAYPKLMEFIGPKGTKFGMQIAKNDHKALIFQVDKGKILEKLADKAEAAGAELRYGSHVTCLIKDNGFIRGVLTSGKEIRSRVVLSAEGLSRKFCNEAGLFAEKPSSCITILCVYLEKLKLQNDELGQKSFLGSVYSSLPRTSGGFHSLGGDKGMIVFSVLLSEKKWQYSRSLTDYLDEFVSRVSWINKLCRTGTVTQKKGCWIFLQKPRTLTANGFIGVGDSVAPLGHSSNAIAMLMGKEAAVIASDALRRSDTSTQALNGYNKWLKSKLFSGVEFEARLITSLLNFTDQEIDTVCDCFSNSNLEPFFIGTPPQQMLATLKLILKPKIIKNWKLIKKFFS